MTIGSWDVFHGPHLDKGNLIVFLAVEAGTTGLMLAHSEWACQTISNDYGPVL